MITETSGVNFNINLEIFTKIDWPAPAANQKVQIARIQSNSAVQSIADKLQPIFTQILISFLDERKAMEQTINNSRPVPKAPTKIFHDPNHEDHF